MKANTIAYVIKPLELTVQRVRLSGYQDIYRAGEYTCFDAARFAENGDAVYVDDEGLLKPNPANNFFTIHRYPNPLCGNGVVLGCDAEGESIEPQTPWEDFKAIVVQTTVLQVNGVIKYLCTPFEFLDDIIDLPAKD